MRNLIIYLSITLFCWISCDKIESPYIEQATLSAGSKTILVEKFTGHQCSNCPAASRIIEEELKPLFINSNNNKSSIISVAIHPGTVSLTETDENYTYDFTTFDGDEIANYVGVTSFIPLGTINRLNGGDWGERCFLQDNWGEKVYSQLIDEDNNFIEQTISINLNNTFNTNTRELSITTTTTIFNDLEGDYALCLFIMEDSIIAPQKDGSDYIENYIHNHIYRCSVNGIYGESLNTSLTEGLILTNTHSIIFDTSNNVNWNTDWNNINNCHVVAYIYNAETGVIEEASEISINNE